MSKYFILGANGHTGHIIATQLLAAGHQVTAQARDAAKIADLTAAGATAAIGDVRDVAFLTTHLSEADAAYLLVPPNFVDADFRAWQDSVSDALAAAVKASGIKKVVFLSSIGAHLGKGAGVVDGLHYTEQLLNAIPELHAVYLRPGYFFENLFANLGAVKHAGILPGGIAPDISMPMVATADIAAVAVQHLLALDFTGKSVHYVAGPEDLTFTQVASIVGAALGKPELPYVHATPDQFRQSMNGMGITSNIVDLYLEFFDGANKGLLTGDYQRTTANTTSTTLAAFAEQALAPAFAAM